MKKIFFIYGLAVAFLAPPAWADGDAAAGKVKTASCVGCHGSDGNSAIALFPRLAGLGEKYLIAQLRHIKAGERAIVEMTGLLDSLSDQDLQDIAAYYDSQKRQLSGAKKTDSKQGENLYRAGNLKTGVAACIACHSPSGAGNNPAGYPALGGQHAEYTEKQLLAYRRGERDSGTNATIMQGVAEALSDKEIKALANYISGLN
ncbi:MAG: cytochrome c4 [Porticoccaceae bacterium]|nr:cytochrome c4 [Porticoccaceae bacterium]